MKTIYTLCVRGVAKDIIAREPRWETHVANIDWTLDHEGPVQNVTLDTIKPDTKSGFEQCQSDLRIAGFELDTSESSDEKKGRKNKSKPGEPDKDGWQVTAEFPAGSGRTIRLQVRGRTTNPAAPEFRLQTLDRGEAQGESKPFNTWLEAVEELARRQMTAYAWDVEAKRDAT